MPRILVIFDIFNWSILYEPSNHCALEEACAMWNLASSLISGTELGDTWGILANLCISIKRNEGKREYKGK